jgi:hypothetical protein
MENRIYSLIIVLEYLLHFSIYIKIVKSMLHKIRKVRKMKKLVLPLTTLFLALFLVISMVQAASVTVTTTPTEITPGESTVITVTCDQGADGSITVYTPGGPYSKSISIPAGGGSVSITYPNDFSGANSDVIGEYRVTIDLDGEEFSATFRVSFNVHVIPEIPLVGTAGAAVAMLSGLGLFMIKRRRPE